MAVYIKVVVEAVIKIQDPHDETTIEEMKEETFLNCPYELVSENYEYNVEDAD